MQANIEYAAIQSARRSSLFNRKEAFAKSGAINGARRQSTKATLDLLTSKEILLQIPKHYEKRTFEKRLTISNSLETLPKSTVQSI